MNKKINELEELKKAVFYLEMKDRLDRVDQEQLDIMNNRINELEQELEQNEINL